MIVMQPTTNSTATIQSYPNSNDINKDNNTTITTHRIIATTTTTPVRTNNINGITKDNTSNNILTIKTIVALTTTTQ